MDLQRVMTREEAQTLLGEVLLRLKYNSPQHVHVCEFTPKDCAEFYTKLLMVAQYLAGPQMPTVRQVAQSWSDYLRSRPNKSEDICIPADDERLQLLCDAVLLLTAPDVPTYVGRIDECH